tara:strand:+ start:1726 stop:2223 length:498 start_codon:yes stop_codon:yes gene_type:complete
MGLGIFFSRRKRIMDFLVSELKRIDGEEDGRAEFNYITVRNGYTYKTNVFNNVFRRMKFLNEINDFPTLCVTTTGEDRIEIGAGVRFGTFGFEIRGYVKDENTIEVEEDLADDIEYALQSANDQANAFEIVDIRITSTETDEGLMTPFGVVIVNGILRYQIQANV